MSIWRLTPIDLFDGTWTRSVHKGEAIIRASTEELARTIAAVTLSGAEKIGPRRKIVDQPWLNPMHVRIERADDTGWAEDGPFMVLDPLGYEDDFTNVLLPPGS